MIRATGGVLENLQTSALEDFEDAVFINQDGDIEFLIAQSVSDVDEFSFSVSEEAELSLWTDAPDYSDVNVTSGDFDNDMDVDVVTYLDREDGTFGAVFWENDGSGNFTSHEIHDEEQVGFAFNVAKADYNVDGALDLLFGDGEGGANRGGAQGSYILLKGDVTANNWIQFDLDDIANLNGLGARVTVTAGTVSQTRGQYGGVHSRSQDDQRLHFGLAHHNTVNVEVVWADNTVSQIQGLAANTVYTLHQDTGTATAYAMPVRPIDLMIDRSGDRVTVTARVDDAQARAEGRFKLDPNLDDLVFDFQSAASSLSDNPDGPSPLEADDMVGFDADGHLVFDLGGDTGDTDSFSFTLDEDLEFVFSSDSNDFDVTWV